MRHILSLVVRFCSRRFDLVLLLGNSLHAASALPSCEVYSGDVQLTVRFFCFTWHPIAAVSRPHAI